MGINGKFFDIINILAFLIEFIKPASPQGDPSRAIYRMISNHIQSFRIDFPLNGLLKGFIEGYSGDRDVM